MKLECLNNVFLVFQSNYKQNFKISTETTKILAMNSILYNDNT